MYVAYKAVHGPNLPAPRHANLNSNYRYQTPQVSNRDLEGKSVLSRPVSAYDMLRLEGAIPEGVEPRRDRGRDPQSIVRDQLRCLATVDEGVGRLMNALGRPTCSGEYNNLIREPASRSLIEELGSELDRLLTVTTG